MNTVIYFPTSNLISFSIFSFFFPSFYIPSPPFFFFSSRFGLLPLKIAEPLVDWLRLCTLASSSESRIPPTIKTPQPN